MQSDHHCKVTKEPNDALIHVANRKEPWKPTVEEKQSRVMKVVFGPWSPPGALRRCAEGECNNTQGGHASAPRSEAEASNVYEARGRAKRKRRFGCAGVRVGMEGCVEFGKRVRRAARLAETHRVVAALTRADCDGSVRRP